MNKRTSQQRYRTLQLSAELELKVMGSDFAESVESVHELSIDLSTPDHKHVYVCLESFKNDQGQTVKDFLMDNYEGQLQELLNEKLGRILAADENLAKHIERIHADG